MVQRERFAVKKKPKDTRGTLIRIAKYLSDYLWIVILLVVLSFLSNLGNLMAPALRARPSALRRRASAKAWEWLTWKPSSTTPCSWPSSMWAATF